MFDTFQVKNSYQTNKIHRNWKKGNPGTGKKAVSAGLFSIAAHGKTGCVRGGENVFTKKRNGKDRLLKENMRTGFFEKSVCIPVFPHYIILHAQTELLSANP